MGLISGILLLLVLSVITYYSLHLLIVCAEHTRQTTFQGVSYKAFGAFLKNTLFLTFQRGSWNFHD
jgi:amino acid permease